MNFTNAAKNEAATKKTENGAMSYSTTNNALIDFFGQIGALRCRPEAEIELKFAEAMAVDPLLATKMMFYAGNIRGGLGERRTFRICLKYLANHYPSIVRVNVNLIPHFNRWDSLFVLVDTPVEQCAWDIITKQLILDIDGVLRSRNAKKKIGISLLAKWMPTETAHSAETRTLAKKAMYKLGMTPRDYRKMLSALRSHLNIVEGLMSNNRWDEIEYPVVPSYAAKNYRHAFMRHDKEGYSQYKESLKKGEAKINANTLYPYDLVHQYMSRENYYKIDDVVEAQWKALPNYVSGENNILVMADVSGSMEGRPMETSIGLATYFAQHNRGDYRGLYMSFSSRPDFINIGEYNTLAMCVEAVESRAVGFNTNLDAAFDRILSHAIHNHINKHDLPKALVVISDMEINPYFCEDTALDFIQAQKVKFENCGYELPKLVLWNVEARNDTFLSKSDDVLLVSGQSTTIFKQLCGSLDGITAYDFMLKMLNDKMYDCVTI